MKRLTAVALLALLAATANGCGAVMAYDRMEMMNDEQALVSDYRRCVEQNVEAPERCQAITAGVKGGGISNNNNVTFAAAPQLTPQASSQPAAAPQPAKQLSIKPASQQPSLQPSATESDNWETQ
jgi:hypothetical protein